MNSLQYSYEALSAKGLFYNKQVTVYVEGQDDLLFWTYLFHIADLDAYIEEVGGNKELEKYIIGILEEEAGFYVACDSDHSEFLDCPVIHEQIIKTYGYSIENSMYNLASIQKIISKLGRKPLDVLEVIEKWAEEFCNNVYELIVYDIANHKYKKGISVMKNCCIPFLTSSRSHKVSPQKVKSFINNIKDNFSEKEINTVKGLLTKSKKDFWFHIKGHFLSNAVINLVKNLILAETGLKKQFSLDSLYALTIDCKEDWENKIDISTVVERIRELKSA